MPHNAHNDDYLLKRLRELDQLIFDGERVRAHRIVLDLQKTLEHRCAAQAAWRLRRLAYRRDHNAQRGRYLAGAMAAL
jgi:hypothetical protein